MRVLRSEIREFRDQRSEIKGEDGRTQPKPDADVEVHGDVPVASGGA
jgi:hypothetical protein